MTTLTRRKYEGVLSFLWAVLGYLALRFSGWHTDSSALFFFVIFGPWWGVSFLLVIPGLRSGSRIGVIASLGTILFFVCLILTLPRIHG
jgi:hypothetical protein